MKNLIKLGVTILLSFILLTGCENGDKQFITGKWETKDGLSYTFKSNNIVISEHNNQKGKYSYEVINPKNDNKVTVKITSDYGHFNFYFGIINSNKIIIEQVKMYDTDGGLISETEDKEKGAILHRIK
ncbi:hypothetical protein [Staphylococcus simulans]|uniref:Lipoprotein n=1 Tax=Staphylococcus simulans UMC-CNS-990 TaxID=1405498 RepID=A0ABN0PFP5_STASI|nr:hypothetical protein [Staphylococcus simulans]ERS94581.1 hypothetical protein SSIM_00375 [Staphylococcus simulans UMC-CNS-990]MCE5148002.1 hypothetical protein [Staphylococcus simulans]PTJ30782.1 hypothetical protein BU026_11235 [Staphylococcus simulans]